MSSTALSGGVAEDKAAGNAPEQVAAERFVSKGLTRGRVKDKNLMLVSSEPQAATTNPVASMQSNAATMLHTSAATALKTEAQSAQEMELNPSPVADVNTQRAQARMKGYEGESCPECANFTLVRNGTCLKCDTCGSTTGCS